MLECEDGEGVAVGEHGRLEEEDESVARLAGDALHLRFEEARAHRCKRLVYKVQLVWRKTKREVDERHLHPHVMASLVYHALAQVHDRHLHRDVMSP